jgi:peptidoglycan/xylan/chitin deacetylase (PgdA/CDA1 family)
MHSSWFQRPVYKQVRWLAVFFIAGSLVYAYFYPEGWLYAILFVALWVTFSVVCTFNIRSGAYIKTINSGDRESNHIFITFDDGPVDKTEYILEILDRYQAKASFFVTGERAKENRDIVKKILEKGHSIGNHSFSHKSIFPFLPVRKIKEELQKTQAILTNIIGNPPKYFRPPYAITNPLIAKALRSFDLITIGWTIRSLDTVIKDPDKVYERIRRRIKPGRIVLLHDTTPDIGKILESVLETCHESGLKAVSLDELNI